MKFGETSFQTKLLSRLSHKVFHLLSSPALLRKFTIMAFIFLMMQGKFFSPSFLPFPGGMCVIKLGRTRVVIRDF